MVDISGLRSRVRTDRERVADEIGKAPRDIGFLYVSGAGVDDSLFERMLAATKEFFALPVEEKIVRTSGCRSVTAVMCRSGKKASKPEHRT